MCASRHLYFQGMATIKLKDLINNRSDGDEPVVNFNATKILSQGHKGDTSPLANIAKSQSRWLQNQKPPLADIAQQDIDEVTARLRNLGLQNGEWATQVAEPLSKFVQEHVEGARKQTKEAARSAELPGVELPRLNTAAQRQLDYWSHHQKQIDEIMQAQQREQEEAVAREKRLVAFVEQQEKREQQRDEQAQAQRRADEEHRRRESRKATWTLIVAAATLIAAVAALFTGG